MKSNSIFKSGKTRTCYCGELDSSYVKKEVVLMGWIRKIRDHGQLIFLDLGDKTGFTQVVVDPKIKELEKTSKWTLESVVAVQGKVYLRPRGSENKNIPTGEIELKANTIELLSQAKPLPFMIEDQNVSEAISLKYRYLQLRSLKKQSIISLSHQLYQKVRSELVKIGFREIHTPVLYKSSPEGARDFLVPSRISPGACYALVQSPQMLKQLLMFSGCDKYFQIARCFRDEDLRADRQPEFNQIDIEMSFVSQSELMHLNGELLQSIWKEFKHYDTKQFSPPLHFKLNLQNEKKIKCYLCGEKEEDKAEKLETHGGISTLHYDQALNWYASDKPDLRNPLRLWDLKYLFRKESSGFNVLDDALDSQKTIKGLALPFAKNFSVSRIKKITKKVQEKGLGGLLWIKNEDIPEEEDKKIIRCPSNFVPGLVNFNREIKNFVSPASRHLNASWIKNLFLASGGRPGGIVFILAGLKEELFSAGELLISQLGKEENLIDFSKDYFLWIKDFPLLEFDTKENKWKAHHHPFTSPLDEDIPSLFKEYNKKKLRAKAYDLVCNGIEIAGGSIRIYQNHVQKAMFKALSIDEEEQIKKFGFFIEALNYGTPPHGGIAWGIDRLIMILSGARSIREVIVFPKTTTGQCLMSDAPSVPDGDQLLSLGFHLITKKGVE